MNIDGSLAVVTGAGSGFGRATSVLLAKRGATVVCADIDLDTATETAERVGGHPYPVDVSDVKAMEDFAGRVKDEHGTPDIVVNNAGIAVIGSFLETSIEDWDKIIDINLMGVVHGCRLFGAQMAERNADRPKELRTGHIVNIASAAAFAPVTSFPAYCTTKAGVLMLSECLRADFSRHGIGVSAICPGFANTGIARNATFANGDKAEVDKLRAAAERGLRLRRYSADRVAAGIVRAIEKNRPVLPLNAEAHMSRALSRIAPGALRALARLDLSRLG